MGYFDTRSTVRSYSDKPLSDEMLHDLLAEAMHAPTCGGMQLYSVVATRSAQGKDALAPAHFNQPCVKGAAAVLTFCADFHRFSLWCRQSHADPGFDNVQSFISAALDATILAQQFVTAAEMRGLGTCYLGTTTWNAPQIISALKLPRLVIPVITVTVGWPAERPEPQPRLAPDSTIHMEEYHPYSTADISRDYAPLEQLPQSRRFVEENGKQTLAQVFTDVRYPRDANEHFSEVFIEVLRSQGFLH